MEIIIFKGKKWREKEDQWTRSHTFDQPKINISRLIEDIMGIIKNYHDKKWTLQFLDAVYNSIDSPSSDLQAESCSFEK
jgi:hypothetical protein